MTFLQRNVKCSNCGSEASLSISSDLDLKELTFAGKCPKCGSTLQINYSIVSSGPSSAPTTTATSDSSPAQYTLDESLFTPEIPSDAIRDLIEE